MDTVARLLAFGKKLKKYQIELVLVDDGSTDGSRELVIELAQTFSGFVKAIILTRNFGQSSAIQAGFKYATGDCIGIISCDLQEPYLEFLKMIHAWEAGNKFIIGERKNRKESQLHQFVSWLYWKSVRMFAMPEFPKIGYDFCLLDRQLADEINRLNEKNTSIFVLLFWLGYRPFRIPITREQRSQGKSQWKFSKKLSFVIDTLIGFTHVPARIITFLGISTGCLSVLYLLFIFGKWQFYGSAPMGWTTVVGLLTLFGSLQLFSLGILSEYLLRILDETRKRPPFIIDLVISKTNPRRLLSKKY